ncbi:hypothetical protein E2562_001148 [Oryza meyeriana var. granulata]|uniref:Uncharacterized protein n=1 Tax=Oryza meyeriana var. granulata TaxID=110450 RepID=A0A6G1EDE2_9ORYZ|nr:hypothetical protein E2562_001148 [Oryza meyeriana var. granulata]
MPPPPPPRRSAVVMARDSSPSSLHISSLKKFPNLARLSSNRIGSNPLTSSREHLVPAYVRLLRDNEAEVQIAAAGKVV